MESLWVILDLSPPPNACHWKQNNPDLLSVVGSDICDFYFYCSAALSDWIVFTLQNYFLTLVTACDVCRRLPWKPGGSHEVVKFGFSCWELMALQICLFLLLSGLSFLLCLSLCFSFSPSSSPFFLHEQLQRQGKYPSTFLSYSQPPKLGENECVLFERLGVPCFVIAAWAD